MSNDPVSDLRAALDRAVASVRGGHAAAAPPSLERPKRAAQGEFATNAAMLLAPALAEPPREIAQRLCDALQDELGANLAAVTVAGPGFVNLTLASSWHRGALGAVLAAGDRFGAGGAAPPERILVEFVSANPTGPVVAASGRHAAFGDTLARILSHYGHTVGREYYVNDFGSQVLHLGASVRARALGEPVPEEGYQGDYVAKIAAALPDAANPSVPVSDLSQQAVTHLLEEIRATLHRYRVDYDRFFSERSLHEGSPSGVEAAIAELTEAGHVYEHDGAVWLRTTDFGDDKDRVLYRTGGDHTYFASDIAYMQSKRDRGWERQILVLGADHHGYVPRLRAAFASLGEAPDRLEALIMQLVHLVEGDERAKMSKRRGEFVTLDDLLDEIGIDATRYFMLQSSHDRTLDLNLDLARAQSNDNPVYYIQYAHARIHSVLGRVGPDTLAGARAAGWVDAPGELEASERELILKLCGLPEEIAEASLRRAPHRIAAYALGLAQQFTAFYRDCPIAGAPSEEGRAFRVALASATGGVLRLVLEMLGVSAPTSM
ncbi:arginine--tRNA ligase [Conexibacter sp. DBS9H8]|uniref:arginine--tRNA ligase n=1 Tax=Conexibacter sp. DBS9H8 TaxID=2937801 RepID=UPI003530F8C7